MQSGSHSIILIFLLFISYVMCEVDYASEIQPIFDNSCIVCHHSNHSKGLNLTTFSTVMAGSNSGVVIQTGDHENSLLFQKINSGAMPPSGNLTENQINLILSWIDEGALEGSLSIISESSLYSDELSIIRNFPNPFNPTTRITYGLSENSDVQIIVYDISGKQIQSLLNDFQSPGYHSINWDAASYPSGMYFAEIKAGKYKHIKKLMLIK